MSDDNSTGITTSDDLDAFSSEFFKGNEKAPVKEETKEPEEKVADTSDEEDTLENESTSDEGQKSKEPPVDEDSSKEEDTDEEEASTKKPAKKTAQERINDITREKYEALREASEAKEAAAKLEERLAALERSREDNANTRNTEGAKAGVPDHRDKNEDGTDKYPLGEFDPSFIRDTARYEVRAELESERARTELSRKEETRIQEEQRLTSEWVSKVKESEVDVKEAQEALKPIMLSINPEYGNYLASVIMSLEKGPEVFRYLADHLDEAEDVINGGPTSATIALGRIESQFLEKPNQPKKKVTTAPKPPPTNRGSSGKYEVAPDTDDLDAFADVFFKK